MTKQIYYEIKRTHLENKEYYQEQVLEFSENVEKKFSFSKQLEKKFEEVEIFVRRESKESIYEDKFNYLQNFKIVDFLNDNVFFLRQKSQSVLEFNNYKRDLAEIITENIEVKNAYNRNKVFKQNTNKKKEIYFTKENRIIEKYLNKNKYLERNNEHLKAVYKDLSNKIICSLNSNYNSNYFKSPEFFNNIINPNLRKRFILNKDIDENKENQILKITNSSSSNSISNKISGNVNRRFSGFNFNIQIYDKNILLNSVKLTPNRYSGKIKSSSGSRRKNSNRKENLKKVIINNSANKPSIFENIINSFKKDNLAIKQESKNSKYMKMDQNFENIDIENNAFVTSFDLNENEDNLGYFKKDYSPNAISSSRTNKPIKPKTKKISFKEKVIQLKKDKKTNSEIFNENKNYFLEEDNKYIGSNKQNYEINNDGDDINNNTNTLNCMETGLEMLPKEKYSILDKKEIQEENLNKNFCNKRKNSKYLFEKERKNSDNNNKDEEEENENLNRNIDLEVDFSRKIKSSIFTKNKENIYDSPKKNLYNFNKILANKSPNLTKRSERGRKSEAKNKVISINNLKNINNAFINSVIGFKNEDENNLENNSNKMIINKRNEIQNVHKNLLDVNENKRKSKNTENSQLNKNFKKRSNHGFDSGKSIKSIILQKSQEKSRLKNTHSDRAENVLRENPTNFKENRKSDDILQDKFDKSNFYKDLINDNKYDTDNRDNLNVILVKNNSFNNVLESNNINYNCNNENINSLFDSDPKYLMRVYNSDLNVNNKNEEDLISEIFEHLETPTNQNVENKIKIKEKKIREINNNLDNDFGFDLSKLNEKNDILNNFNFDIFNNNSDKKDYFLTEKTIENSDNDNKNSPLSSQSRKDSSPFSTLKTKSPKRLSDPIENPDIWDLSCIVCQTES